MADRIVRECPHCGKSFKTPPNNPKKHCSRDCYHERQRAGKYNRGHRETTPKAPCSNCGSLVVRSRGKKRTGGRADNVFCDRQCYDAYRRKVIESRKQECPGCGTIFIREGGKASNKYCCHDCKVAHKRAKPKRCVNCNTLFTPLKLNKKRGSFISVNNAKTCSHDCHLSWISNNEERKRKISAAFSGNGHPNWQGGTHRLSGRGSGWVKLAERVRKRAGHECEHCGMSQEENGRALDVNHIVPFHQFGGKTQQANKMSNLEALCISCHMKTDWKWRKENPLQLNLMPAKW